MLCIIMTTVNLSSLFPVFVLIVLLAVAAIFVAVHTDGQSKVSFQFQSCLLVSTVLNCLVSQSQTLSSYKLAESLAPNYMHSHVHLY